MDRKLYNRRCPRCRKISGNCRCDDICPNCMHHMSHCQCEKSLRTGRPMPDERDDLEMDEDVQHELQREYGREPKPDTYWHGYNIVRKIGPKRRVYCPYTDVTRRRSFYRGVSDARGRV